MALLSYTKGMCTIHLFIYIINISIFICCFCGLIFDKNLIFFFDIYLAGSEPDFRCGGSLINENYVLTGLIEILLS